MLILNRLLPVNSHFLANLPWGFLGFRDLFHVDHLSVGGRFIRKGSITGNGTAGGGHNRTDNDARQH